MAFEIDKCYKHTGGMVIHIAGEANSIVMGRCFVAEEPYSAKFKPVGKDDIAAAGWIEISKDEYMESYQHMK